MLNNYVFFCCHVENCFYYSYRYIGTVSLTYVFWNFSKYGAHRGCYITCIRGNTPYKKIIIIGGREDDY